MNNERDRLKIILDSSGYTMRRFAREIGITPGGLSGIINGRSKVLSGMFIKLLEYRFNVNPVWLQTGEGQTYVKKFFIEDKEEIDHILKFRLLDKEHRKSISDMTTALYRQKHPEDFKDSSKDSMVAETLRKKSKEWP